MTSKFPSPCGDKLKYDNIRPLTSYYDSFRPLAGIS